MSSARTDLLEVAMSDPRYAVEAYEFLCQALAYTQQVIRPGEQRGRKGAKASADDEGKVRHVSGQDLCEGIRKFALDQFGLMAPTVLRCWGIRRTEDFGKMVYFLIESGLWHKSENDSMDDFVDQFDFQTAFTGESIEWRVPSSPS